MTKTRMATLIGLLACGLLASAPAEAANRGHRTVTQFVPHLEWSIDNVTYSGNPFDVVAKVTFTHGSGKNHVTEMFYDGGSTFKFRFVGTHTGDWSFTTSSDTAALDRHIGTITVAPNPNPKVRGELVVAGDRLARRINDTELEPFIMNVFQNVGDQTTWNLDRLDDQRIIAEYLDETEDNGFNTVTIPLYHQVFKRGAMSYRDHDSEVPDLSTFRTFEKLLVSANQRGLHFHARVWHDEQRRRTPVGLPGGVNGRVDRRMQRYMAARWGAILGWSLTYGSDLEEWASESDVGAWAKTMRSKLGWNHILSARGRVSDSLEAIALSNYGGGGLPKSYEDVIRDISKQADRPHWYEERFHYLRYNGLFTQDFTRRSLWCYLMAGGVGSWWGYGPWDNDAKKGPYPNPEQFRTYRDFWQSYFLLDMVRANKLSGESNTRVLSCGSNRLIFYREDADAIQIDLSGMSGPQPAVAVDTKKAYAEVSLGALSPARQTIQLPYSSDWAVAVGSFPDKEKQ